MEQSEFLTDENGEIQNQRYRIGQLVAEEVRRRDNTQYDLQEARIKVRPYTKLEQSIMDRIPAKQKQNVVQTQVVCGKVYAGEGFLATPTSVEFVDFDVGKRYERTVTLTNISRSFNAFRVLDVPKDVRDVLDVVYAPASTMSAGMASKITIIFTPKENVDITTEIPLLAKTGPLSIPVKCTRKRVVVSASTKLVDFGSCVIAEDVERKVVIRNDGALPCTVSVTGELLATLKETQSAVTNGITRRVLSVNLQKLNNVRIDPFSSLTFVFHYTPLIPSEMSSSMYLTFDNDEVDDIVVFFKGSAIDVPVYVSRNRTLNMNCCFFGTLYRDVVTIHNTTKSAVMVQPEIPEILSGCLDYVPKFGFVQPDSSLDFQVKFTPEAKLGPEILLKVPIVVAGQAMPIYYELVASLSEHNITFDPPTLAYGFCAVGEALSQPVIVTNNSRLIRKIGFIKLPPSVKVLPKSTWTLQPKEAATFTVCVEATAPGPFKHVLHLKTETDENYSLTVIGEGKPAPLRLSVSNVKLPACAFYDAVSATTLLTNTSNSLQRYSFVVNPRYCLTISPSAGELAKGQSTPVTIVFKPNPALMSESSSFLTNEEIAAQVEAEVTKELEEAAAKLPPPPPSKKKSKAEEEAERIEREKKEEAKKAKVASIVAARIEQRDELRQLVPWEVASEENEPLSYHRRLTIPCYVDGWRCKAIFLELACSIAPAALVPVLAGQGAAGAAPAASSSGAAGQAPSTATAPGKNTNAVTVDDSGNVVLDFGSVPALQTVSRALTLKNASEAPINVEPESLDPFGPFQIVRPPTTLLHAGHETEVVLSFTPATQAPYLQEAVFRCGVNAIRIAVRGEGLPAMLSIQEKGAAAGAPEVSAVELGHCVIGETLEKALVACNGSPFPLQVEASVLKASISHFNPNGSVPFQLIPNRFTVPAFGKYDLTLAFNPQKEANFSAKIQLAFGGSQSVKTLNCVGHGWERGLYVQFPAKESNYSAAKYANPFSDAGDAPPAQGSAANPLTIQLAALDGHSSSCTIVVGNTKSSTNGEYTIEGFTDADSKMGWKIDPVKGTVAAGVRSNVVITFTPTAALFESLPLRKIGVVSLCNIRLVLKGGSPANDTVYHLKLKGTATKM